MKFDLRALFIGLLVTISLLSGACAPAGRPGAGEQSAGSGAPAAPKILTLGILYEPESLNLQLTGGTGGVGAASTVANVSHDTLMVEDALGNNLPQLAVQVPSVSDGTWRVN